MPEGVNDDNNKVDVTALPVAKVDWFLQNFVNMANNPAAGIEIGITLHVGGTLVSGTLISGKKYFDGIAEIMVKANTNMPEIAESWRSFSEFGTIYDAPPEDSTQKNPQYIHLLNAHTFSSGGTPIPSGLGVLWRGRLTDVSGFSLGVLNQN